MYRDDIDELKAKRICFECVGESYLSEEVERDGQVAQCSYCGRTYKTFSIEEMADRVETAFDDQMKGTRSR